MVKVAFSEFEKKSTTVLFYSSLANIKRPLSEPPPPPLPKEPPPNVIDEKITNLTSCKHVNNASDAFYEVMSSGNSCDDDYLLPNSLLKPTEYFDSDSQENINYEYIQYNLIDNNLTNSSDSSSMLSSRFSNFEFWIIFGITFYLGTSKGNLKFDINEGNGSLK